MKKPKQDLDSSSQTSLQSQTGAGQAELFQLCKGFVDSHYYQKAMADPGYMREQAITDFLTGMEYDPQTAGRLVEWIRRNYYRAF